MEIYFRSHYSHILCLYNIHHFAEWMVCFSPVLSKPFSLRDYLAS
jgi:hypothetical protein